MVFQLLIFRNGKSDKLFYAGNFNESQAESLGQIISFRNINDFQGIEISLCCDEDT